MSWYRRDLSVYSCGRTGRTGSTGSTGRMQTGESSDARLLTGSRRKMRCVPYHARQSWLAALLSTANAHVWQWWRSTAYFGRNCERKNISRRSGLLAHRSLLSIHHRLERTPLTHFVSVSCLFLFASLSVLISICFWLLFLFCSCCVIRISLLFLFCSSTCLS